MLTNTDLWVIVVEGEIKEAYCWRHRTRDAAEMAAKEIAERNDVVAYVARLATKYHREVRRESLYPGESDAA